MGAISGMVPAHFVGANSGEGPQWRVGEGGYRACSLVEEAGWALRRPLSSQEEEEEEEPAEPGRLLGDRGAVAPPPRSRGGWVHDVRWSWCCGH